MMTLADEARDYQKDKRRRAKVYLKAAERIATGRNRWSCCAVAGVSDSHLPVGEAVALYESVFRGYPSAFWGSAWDGYAPDLLGFPPICPTAAGKNCRILALCLMAAMVEAGDA